MYFESNSVVYNLFELGEPAMGEDRWDMGRSPRFKVARATDFVKTDLMAKCKNIKCRKELKKGQTNYCSRACRNEYINRPKPKFKRSDDSLLGAGITGRGMFDHEGND